MSSTGSRPQVAGLVLNANGDPDRFAAFGLPVVADSVPDFAGPLAGILAGLDWAAAHRPDCPDVVSVPTDAPFLPRDLVARLLRERKTAGADLACAASGGQAASGRRAVAGAAARFACAQAVVAEGIRKVDVWTARYRLRMVDFPEERPGLDPFFNANRPDDLDRAAELLGNANRPGGRRGKAIAHGSACRICEHLRRLIIFSGCCPAGAMQD